MIKYAIVWYDNGLRIHKKGEDNGVGEENMATAEMYDTAQEASDLIEHEMWDLCSVIKCTIQGGKVAGWEAV